MPYLSGMKQTPATRAATRATLGTTLRTNRGRRGRPGEEGGWPGAPEAAGGPWQHLTLQKDPDQDRGPGTAPEGEFRIFWKGQASVLYPSTVISKKYHSQPFSGTVEFDLF
jgi:hypothetical protein